ncbi:MAG: hypothetical protein WC745_04875 [Patescibacteria group bacterium]|jgi:hypothetical protein
MTKYGINLYAFRQNVKERYLDLAAIPGQKTFMALNSAALILISFIAFLIIRSSSQDLLILHYNVATGVDFIGGEKNLLIFPALSFLFFALNTALSLVVKKERKFAGYLLQAGCLACDVILFLSLAIVYVVNFR